MNLLRLSVPRLAGLKLQLLPALLLLAMLMGLVSCADSYIAGPNVMPRAVVRTGLVVTLRDQKMSLLRDGKLVESYPISSSKFGLSSTYGSCHTPTGIHAVNRKVGYGQPKGMVFKARRPTGEVVEVDAQGRDPIVSRIIQITGLEYFNKNSYRRRIYIHGTPEERRIGTPASYGCIRMKSDDIIELYPYIERGMPVAIERCSLAKYEEALDNSNHPRMIMPKDILKRMPREDIRFRPSKRYRRR